MTPNEERWQQGAFVLNAAPHPLSTLDAKQLVRDADYVILQMMGKIAHRCALLPRRDYSNWPYGSKS